MTQQYWLIKVESLFLSLHQHHQESPPTKEECEAQHDQIKD